MTNESTNDPTPLEQELATAISRRQITIGLPKCLSSAEHRFPITPEAAQVLAEQGYTIRIEQGAGDPIHYTDAQYSRAGADICSRRDALSCDIVLHIAPLSPADINLMRRGAMLFTLLPPWLKSPDTLRRLLKRGIITIALDLIRDTDGNEPFADVLAEIDGRAAIARASSLLADAKHGKGILLGGVAGVVPCEVTVIGSDIAARSAARSALGQGAMVRMLDHDVYRLRAAAREVGPGVIVASLHPRALAGAVRTADVIIHTPVSPPLTVDSDTIRSMKRGVVIFDLTPDPGNAFPSLPTIDLAQSSPVDIVPDTTSRVCYSNAGNLVPRTAAMAISDAFITMMHSIATCEGFTNALKLLPGLQRAALTFSGKVVNREVAETISQRHVDINIYLTLS